MLIEKQKKRWGGWTWGLAAAYPSIFFDWRPTNDIWFLLNSGRYVLKEGIPHVEPFSMHQGFDFVMQQWLSALIFWGAYAEAGMAGVNLLVLLCLVGTLLLFFKLCMHVSEQNTLVSFSATLFCSLVLTFFTAQRPSVFSNALLAAELYTLERFMTSRNIGSLAVLPVLSILLINLHGALWPMIFVFIAPYMAESLFKKDWENLRRLSLAGLAAALAGFVNPYGWEAMAYFFRSWGHPEISNYVWEMKPLRWALPRNRILLGYIAAVYAAYAFRRPIAPKPRYVLLTAGTSIMAFMAVKSVPFFALGAVFPLAYRFKSWKIPTEEPGPSRKVLRQRRVLMVLIATLSLSCFAGRGQSQDPSMDKNQRLREVVEQIDSKQNTKVYAGYDEGGMVEFLGHPAYIDPRAEVFVRENNSKVDIMEEFYLLQYGSLSPRTFLSRYDFTHLVVSPKDALYEVLVEDNAYRLVYTNHSYYLFEPMEKERSTKLK